MNIVDVIKSQLTGDVLGKLSSLVGESEDKTRTAVERGRAGPALDPRQPGIDQQRCRQGDQRLEAG